MGISSSIVDRVNSSSELCGSCDENEAKECTRCKRPVCAECCPHKHNVLFDAKPVPLKSYKLRIAGQKHLKQIEAKCGIYTRKKELQVIGEAVYDQFTEWRIFNLVDDKTKPGTVTKQHPLYERSMIFPGDMCWSDELNQTFLTLPCTKTVYRYREHTFDELFSTEGSCFGIAWFDGGFAVSIEMKSNFSLSSEWQVQVLNAKGKLEKQFYYDCVGNPMFKRPLFLDSNRSGTTLFVSDFEKQAIIALDNVENKLYKFNNPILYKPSGLAVDTEENVYVACGPRVVQIEKGGVNFRELLPVKNTDRAVGVVLNLSKTCSLSY